MATRKKPRPFLKNDNETARGLRVRVAVLKSIQAGKTKTDRDFYENYLFDREMTGGYLELEKTYVKNDTPNWPEDPRAADGLLQELEEAKKTGEITGIDLNSPDGMDWFGTVFFSDNPTGLSSSTPWRRPSREEMICELYIGWLELHLGLHAKLYE